MKQIVKAETLSDAVSLLRERQGACTIPAHINKALIDCIIEEFMALLETPKKYRLRWLFTSEGDIEPDDGLIERYGDVHDHKFFFHYKGKEYMNAFLKKSGLEGEHKDFMELLDLLYENILLPKADELFRVMQTMHPEWNLSLSPATPRGVLRLLYYKPGHTRVAQPHYDQSLFTFHIADSHPGLVLSRQDEEQKNVYVPKLGRILVFPGMKSSIVSDTLCQMLGYTYALNDHWRPKSVIPATYHAAIADEKATQEGRWAIVFFYHCDVGLTSKQISVIAKHQMELFLS